MDESTRAEAPGIDLHIERLVLHGFRAGDRHAIAAALERELNRLFAEQGLPPELSAQGPQQAARPHSLLRLRAGSFHVPHDATPEMVGTQLARTIHRGLGNLSSAPHEARR